ncbi:hypothetical protein AO057_15965 [Curvibacter sp. PAE-UM]|nr:hypothetical protein AO057_15965 [Curvibacter sp. PAE-UM]
MLLIYIGIKPMFVTMWTTESVAGTYELHGKDGRSLVITFLPDREILMAYREESTGYLEVAKAKATGHMATHYFGPFWSIAKDGSMTTPFDLRLYFNDEKPAIVQIKIEQKYTSQEGKDVFLKTGESNVSVLLFRPKEFRFDSMWLEHKPVDQALVAKTIQLLDMK